MKDLIFRVDAGNKIGTGHLMRCLALAQAWQDTGGRAVFITTCRNESLLERLDAEGFAVHRLPENNEWGEAARIIAGYDADWLVLDGYHFDEAYQRSIKDAGYKLLAIDDMAHLKHYYADIILNQNLHAEQLSYECEPHTRLLMGTDYVLLRREFLAYKGRKPETAETAKKILLTMGGSDPNNITLKVIQALGQVGVPGIEAIVVIGASNQNADALRAAAGESLVHMQTIRNAGNMPELMAEADVAVCSAGTTVWELVYSGVPMLLSVIADNQQDIMQSAIDKKIALPFSIENIKLLLNNRQLRADMGTASRSIVDGLGTRRIVQFIR